MALLNETQRQEFTASYPEWTLAGNAIQRTFTFSGFVEAIGFVNQVAPLAEEANHHPDIDIRWNKVTLALSTHSEGGLTAKDTDLASIIEARLRTH